MKYSIFVCIFIFAYVQSVIANDFSSSLTLGKHTKDNPYGVWTLEKKFANTKQLKAKILPKTEFDTYPCLQYIGGKGCWDIRIIDVQRYKKTFLNHRYYHFFWKKKKNQGYSDPNGEKINASISPIPQVMIHVRNNTASSVILLDIESKSIFQQGGMADSTKSHILPKVQKGAMEIAHNKSDKMTFPKGYKLNKGKEITLPLSLWVKNAAEGDGTGDLAYALVMHYKYAGKNKHEVLVNMLQSDGEGYDLTAGGIAPAN